MIDLISENNISKGMIIKTKDGEIIPVYAHDI